MHRQETSTKLWHQNVNVHAVPARWGGDKKVGQKMQRTINLTERKMYEGSHTGDRKWNKWERGDSTRARSPSGKCCLLPQDVAGVTLLALLEILWIQLNVSERKEGFWYLYWKSMRYRKRTSSKISLADCYGQCFKLIIIPQSLNVFKGRWGYGTAIRRKW